MWSCEVFAVLKRGRGYGGGSFCHGLFLYVTLSQVIANCWKRGIHWVSWWSANHQKSFLPPKTPMRSDMSVPQAKHVRPPGQTSPASQPFPELTKHIRLSGRIPEAFPGHVQLPAQTCSTWPNFLSVKVPDRTYPVLKPGSRGVGGTCPALNPDMSGFLAPQWLFLVV
jgi:hypothetical protein